MGDRDTRSLLTDAMEACVGQAFRRVVSFPVSASDIRRWAIAVYHPELPPRRYWDEQYCIESAWGGLIAPEDFNPFAWATASPPLDAGVRAERPWPEPELGLAVPATRAYILSQLSVTHTGVGIRPGDELTSTTTLVGYREREGALGLMLYTTLQDNWVNQRHEPVRTATSVLIRYR